ncbi:tripartite tricarboxylate transporter TctB family protein [Limnochorda sp.]|uniref:tripartite tricarboxylate transporter TctB family protein n=1 Tax=Limnochorda sp. TaxID=1940279 RepID=UPI001DEB7B4F|nr:hypothetical protein [Bacillota bacterium]MBO2519670.1 hypothetical protein [Bacillota bacterium]
MLNADVVAALLWTLLLGATYWLTLDFPPGPAGVPGPGYVPRLLVVVGLVLAVFLFRSGRRGQVEAVNWRAFGKDRLLRAGGVVGLLFLYTLLWGRVHWAVLSTGFLFLVGLVLKLRAPVALATAVGLSVTLYWLFRGVFHVML